MPPLSFGTCNHPQCDSGVSVEHATTSTPLSLKSDNLDWKACNSDGQTNVKSLG